MAIRQPLTLVVMGVSGSGKTSVGRLLAGKLDWPFQEGDDLHPPDNVAKMRAGIPLDDADRAPWLARIAAWIDSQRAAHAPGIVACSALKRAYRDGLAEGRPEVWFLYLKVSRATALQRLARRQGHFMPVTLLDSQFDTLEEPGPDERVLTVEVDDKSPAEAAEAALRLLEGEAVSQTSDNIDQ